MGLSLGPFTIDEHVATGGHGQIWRGKHAQSKLPVAIKFLTSEKSRSQEFYTDFWHEAQTAARLNHPNIVMVFDYGVLPANFGELSKGKLVAESPYLIMEYATHGTLRELAPNLTWLNICRILLALLDALAYAHARGVVHRDIKPANILISGLNDPRPGLKLSDFGIAHALEHTDQELEHIQGSARAGTLTYMAPEQFRGRWRDYGPWTDLYALGIVAYELISGTPPFHDGNYYKLAQQHLSHVLPALQPTCPVPNGIEAWLRKLTHKHPTERFQRAADAAWALQKLNASDDAHHPLSNDKLPLTAAFNMDGASHKISNTDILSLKAPTSDITASLDVAQLVTLNTFTAIGAGDEDEEGPQICWIQDNFATRQSPDVVPDLPSPEDTPPFPLSWRIAAPRIPIHLQGAGLGLYGLRTVPMVDREELRDTMWGALWDVRETGHATALVLRGVSGCGKSRLAEWLCERAHEVGTAHILKAFHDSTISQTNGLSRMMTWHFMCQGLDREDANLRLQKQLAPYGVVDSYEWRALNALMFGQAQGNDQNQTVRFNGPKERYVLIQRHLQRLGHNRPVIVWLDDAHWNIETLALTRHVLEHGRRCPVLFVLTVSEETLVSRRRESELLEQLVAMEDVSAHTVPPLESEDSRVLIEMLLGLSGEIVSRIEERIEGNPLFAVQLIDDWVQRGILTASANGFTPRKDEPLLIPDSLHSVWTSYITQALSGLGDEAREALELAAVLGVAVVSQELEIAAQQINIQLLPAWIERLQQRRLALPTLEGWHFAHSMIRESLTRSAREGGRFEQLHRACLAMLSQLYVDDAAEIQARRAYHLTESGDLEEALDALLTGARGYLDRSSFRQAHDLLDTRESLIDSMPSSHSKLPHYRANNATLRAQVHRVQWELDDAERWAILALDLAKTHQFRTVDGEALAIQAHIARHRGDLETAQALATQALSIFEELKNNYGIADATLNLAIIARVSGNAHQNAIALYSHALELFEALGDASKAAQCLYGLGNLHRQRQDYDTARDFYIRARTIFSQVGNRAAKADCINGLADIDRYLGKPDAAETGYREAWNLLLSVGSQNAPIVHLNLGISLIQGGRYQKARDEFDLVLRTEQDKPAFIAIAHACLLPCLAYEADTRGFDLHCILAARQLVATSTLDPDLAVLAQMAGRLWLDQGQHKRARRAYQLSHDQWIGLGNTQQAAQIQEILTSLS